MSLHALPRPSFVHLEEIRRRPQFLERWEKIRNGKVHWFAECLAEALGVFIYTYAGVGSTAGWILGNIIQEEVSSLYQVGLAYAIGIVLATVICGPTSGAHFSPSSTLVHVLFRKFPVMKGIRYIIAQIIGAYIACLIVYLQYRHLILEVEAGLAAKGVLDELLFTSQGPAGIFGLYIAPGSSIGQVLMNEFVCCFVLGIAIWGVSDPTNFYVTPVAGPWLVAFAYAICIWGYAPVGVALNTARDVGGRLMVLTIWGTKAAGGNYAALAALTNLIATPIAVLFYEVFLTSSSRVITPSEVDFISARLAHNEHREASLTTSASSSMQEKEPQP